MKWQQPAKSGPCTLPAVGPDGAIYASIPGDSFVALNPDGVRKWCYPASAGFVRASPAISSNGTIYVGSADDTLYALSADGALEWCYGTNGWILSAPAIGADGTVYVGTVDGALYAITGTGTLANAPWPKFHHDSRNSGQY